MRFQPSALSSVAIALAVWLAAWTLRPMFIDTAFLTWVPALVGAAAVVGALGVLLRFPRAVTLGAQAVVMASLLLWLGFRDAPRSDDPDASWYEPLVMLGALGTKAVRESSTPLPTEPGLVWLLLCILALVVLAMETLVNVLEQPAWALAPLGVIYGVGALTLANEMEWTSFAAVAVGYALVLATSTHLSGASPGRTSHQATRAAVILVTLVVASVLAPALTNFVPLGDKQPWLQAGRNKPITLSDPTVALNENLRRPADEVVLRYSTDSETPVYLRTVALTRLTTDGAALTGMRLSTTGLSGAYTAPGESVKTRVRMLLASEYLPVPFAVDRFSAAGAWAHDRDTMSIVATGGARTEQTEGLEYEVSSTVPRPDRSELEAAAAGTDPAGDDTLSVPGGLDPGVATLTASVTAQARTAGEKALAIQSFLRSDEFSYSLNAPEEADTDAISSFLLTDHAGYCIHFAAGMITMARIEGIPARMAIGFTPGKRDGDEWVVTTHNMHSWPELYFEGLGWVPFEPTKSVASPPEYTDPDVAPNASPSPTPSPSATGAPSASPSIPVEPPEPTVAPTPPGGSDSSNPGGWFLLLGVLVLLAAPMAARSGVRVWRLRAGQEPAAAADAAWREVGALFTDTGLEFSDASPVLAAKELGKHLDPSAASELGAVAGIVQRARYARDGADTSDLGVHVRQFRRALLRTQPGNRQTRALLLPLSLAPMNIRRG
ncbi:transglutaminase family protein [Tessaracoccus antarcticus]|nr:DUF3488 and transglutaminase-like domain-containing protein [Tessaracoccus antarcticus]